MGRHDVDRPDTEVTGGAGRGAATWRLVEAAARLTVVRFAAAIVAIYVLSLIHAFIGPPSGAPVPRGDVTPSAPAIARTP